MVEVLVLAVNGILDAGCVLVQATSRCSGIKLHLSIATTFGENHQKHLLVCLPRAALSMYDVSVGPLCARGQKASSLSTSLQPSPLASMSVVLTPSAAIVQTAAGSALPLNCSATTWPLAAVTVAGHGFDLHESLFLPMGWAKDVLSSSTPLLSDGSSNEDSSAGGRNCPQLHSGWQLVVSDIDGKSTQLSGYTLTVPVDWVKRTTHDASKSPFCQLAHNVSATCASVGYEVLLQGARTDVPAVRPVQVLASVVNGLRDIVSSQFASTNASLLKGNSDWFTQAPSVIAFTCLVDVSPTLSSPYLESVKWWLILAGAVALSVVILGFMFKPPARSG